MLRLCLTKNKKKEYYGHRNDDELSLEKGLKMEPNSKVSVYAEKSYPTLSKHVSAEKALYISDEKILLSSSQK